VSKSVEPFDVAVEALSRNDTASTSVAVAAEGDQGDRDYRAALRSFIERAPG